MEGLKNITKSKWLWIAIIVIALIFIFWLYNWLKGKASAIQNKSEFQQLQTSTGEQPTLSPSQLSTIASTIYSSLNEDWTNNISSIQTAFNELKNDADYLGLQQAFGTRSWGLVFKDNYSLIEALHAFLTNSQINTLNATLAASNITYTI